MYREEEEEEDEPAVLIQHSLLLLLPKGPKSCPQERPMLLLRNAALLPVFNR